MTAPSPAPASALSGGGRGEAPAGAGAARWQEAAACRRDPDAWFQPSTVARSLAVHQCRRHCPVLDECTAYADVLVRAGKRPALCVLAGRWWNTRGQPIQAVRRFCGPDCEVPDGS